jgi:hypothetical protein
VRKMESIAMTALDGLSASGQKAPVRELKLRVLHKVIRQST